MTRARSSPRYDAKDAIALAFIAGLQHLPPRQRAVLVLRDVAGFAAAEVAEMLETSEASVNGTLGRARATLNARVPVTREPAPLPHSRQERVLLARFTEAFEGGDSGGIAALLADDALLTMPPQPGEYRGRAVIGELLAARFATLAERRVRCLWTRANGQPAFGYYIEDPDSTIRRSHGLIVLTLAGDRVAQLTQFSKPRIRSLFGLPPTIPE